MKLFSGTANPALAEKVAKVFGKPLSKSEVIRFDNSEVRVTIQDEVKGETAVVIQPSANPTDTHLMELFFFADALKREEAKEIVAVIPYFGYARQNIQHRKGEDVSANVVVKFLEAVGFDRVYVFDIHDEATGGIFSIPFSNLSAYGVLAKEADKLIKDKKNVIIVSPDQAGVERARVFGESFFKSDKFDIAVVEKKRDLNKIHQSKAVDLYGDVKGKIAILVDDVITSAGTLVHAAELVEKGGAKEIYAAVTHHDFSFHALTRIKESPIKTVLTSDTIVLKDQDKDPRIVEVSVAPVIAEELKKFKD